MASAKHSDEHTTEIDSWHLHTLVEHMSIIDIAGSIWNHCIALHRRAFRLTGKHLNQFDLLRHLTKLKKSTRFALWNQLGSQAIQVVVQRIARAYQLFFGNLKRGVKTSPPKFRKVKKYCSFTVKQAGWKLLEGNKIRMG